MAMKIKSFGCSFIFGTDLKDNPSDLVKKFPVGQFSRLTWPALLANKFNADYECCARPGSGNLQIAERVLNSCAEDTSSFYIIDWTWIDRFDYMARQDFWQPWDTLRPSGAGVAAEMYYKKLHSEYRDKLTTLISVKAVIDTLIAKDIKFLMTYEDQLMFDQRWHINPGIKDLQHYIQPFMSTFEGQSFLNWSRSCGYPESETWHPLEQAHVAAADLMSTVFDKQRTNGPAKLVT